MKLYFFPTQEKSDDTTQVTESIMIISRNLKKEKNPKESKWELSIENEQEVTLDVYINS